jgi:hypothetical protein
MIGISSQPLLVKNLKILHTFGEYPAKLENIKDFQSSLGIFGDSAQSPPARFVHLQDTAAQTSPHESEEGNLNDVFDIFCLSSFMRR